MSPTDPPTGPPTGPPAEEPTQPLDAQTVGRGLDRLERRVQALADAKCWDDDLRDIWKSLRHLGDGLTVLLAPGGPDNGRAWLLQVGEDPEKLTERLADLETWLNAVYLRYPGNELPSCWLWHPWLIEELLWLRRYHAKAYGPQDDPVAQGMWHDQSMPRLVERVRKHLGSCSLQDHKPGGQAAKDPIAAPLAGHIHALADAWSTTGLPPEPTAEQLEDARKHRELKLRRP